MRCAQALGRLGQETAIPALAAARKTEPLGAVQEALDQAASHLFRGPAPGLTVQLLGGFAASRGGVPIPEDAWGRPIVQRLFQYFAIHAGRPVPRDRLLDALWPDRPPARAKGSLRTVYSLLRKALEPFMPPRGPNRYFVVAGETYTFDPGGAAEIDLVRFRARIRAHIAPDPAQSPESLPPAFLHALENYGDLLPGLPYAEWLFAARQEAEELFLAGCHHAAGVRLAQGAPEEAIHWAERVVQRAAWHEEAYQILMRAHARLGRRTAALRVFQQARERLREELDVEPSALTAWLAEQIRQGQEV